MQQRLYWLDYDPVAFAVLVIGMGCIRNLRPAAFTAVVLAERADRLTDELCQRGASGENAGYSDGMPASDSCKSLSR